MVITNRIAHSRTGDVGYITVLQEMTHSTRHPGGPSPRNIYIAYKVSTPRDIDSLAPRKLTSVDLIHARSAQKNNPQGYLHSIDNSVYQYNIKLHRNP
jgi:hypothetical protein